MKAPTLTFSLADLHFSRTKSVGILNVARGLLLGLAGSAHLGRLTALTNRTLPLPPALPEWAVLQQHNFPIKNRFSRLLWDQWRLYRVAASTGNDWLFLPKGFASFVRRCPVRLAAYVHDTIPLYYREHHPQAYPPGESWYFSRCFWATLRQAQVIFTNTEHTRQAVRQAAQARGLTAPPVVVAGIGFEEPVAFSPHKEARIVCLASPWPHKLTARAVEWLERWRAHTDFRGAIEVVGRLPRGVALPPAPVWHDHERLPENLYRELLGSARALVYFSEIEGFGMPPVEAVLAGACPVYSDIPAHREVMADAGCAFANDDYPSFARALELALAIPPEQVAAWRTQLLARHNWGAATARVVGALSA